MSAILPFFLLIIVILLFCLRAVIDLIQNIALCGIADSRLGEEDQQRRWRHGAAKRQNRLDYPEYKAQQEGLF